MHDILRSLGQAIRLDCPRLFQKALLYTWKPMAEVSPYNDEKIPFLLSSGSPFMATALSLAVPSRWELAAELIAVKIRWFGLIVGYVLVNIDPLATGQRPVLNAILALGGAYA